MMKHPSLDRQQRVSPVTLAIAGIAVVGLSIVVIMAWPYLSTTTIVDKKEMFRKSQTLANAKLLSKALLMYVEHHDGQFPARLSSADDLRSALGSKVPSEAFVTLNPIGGSFLPNPNLQMRSMRDIIGGVAVILVFESNPWQDGRRVCGIFDADRWPNGAAMWVEGEQDLSIHR